MAKTNYLYITFQDAVSLDFKMTEHYITSGQSFKSVTFNQMSKNQWRLTVEADRKGSDSVASWFKSGCSGGSAVATKTDTAWPDDLNFALKGDLTFVWTYRDKQLKYIIKDLMIAQGHRTGSNNWWIGHRTMGHQLPHFLGYVSTKGTVTVWSDVASIPDATMFVPGSDSEYFSICSNIDEGGWMSLIDGNKYLYELSIPGTHDSCTWDLPVGSQCQDYTIDQQLRHGIRFFDLRLDEDLELRHGIKHCGLYFKDVLESFNNFFAESIYKEETILISVKEEKGSIYRYLDAFLRDSKNASLVSRIWRGTRIPKLQDVRGKIVMFRRFALEGGVPEDNWGINVQTPQIQRCKEKKGAVGVCGKNEWPDNMSALCDNGHNRFYIEDRFKSHSAAEDTTIKKDLMSDALRSASGIEPDSELNVSTSDNSTIMYITFSSMALTVWRDGLNTAFPITYAWGGKLIKGALNPILSSILGSIKEKKGKKFRTGVVVMDFYRARDASMEQYLVAKIIDSNFDRLQE